MTHQQPVRVTVGVDTHLDVHIAVVLDQLGQRLGQLTIDTTTTGYRELLEWARGHGVVERFGVEGTSSYGAALTRFLIAEGVAVVEVTRPNRQLRRRRGKSDAIDAEAAARAALAGDSTVAPKAGTDSVEMIRTLRVARSTAIKARTQAINALRALLVTAPADLRDELRALPGGQLVSVAAAFDTARPVGVTDALRCSLACLARRHQALDQEIKLLSAHLDELVAKAAPALVKLQGVGTETAGQLLITAGDNPDRLRSEAAFSMLCGASPQPASSGKTNRHRLNRAGDRQANAALYRIALSRMRWDPTTQAYVQRRTKEGKTKLEIIRCLKRYIAREIYTTLTHPTPT